MDRPARHAQRTPRRRDRTRSRSARSRWARGSPRSNEGSGRGASAAATASTTPTVPRRGWFECSRVRASLLVNSSRTAGSACCSRACRLTASASAGRCRPHIRLRHPQGDESHRPVRCTVRDRLDEQPFDLLEVAERMQRLRSKQDLLGRDDGLIGESRQPFHQRVVAGSCVWPTSPSEPTAPSGRILAADASVRKPSRGWRGEPCQQSML